MEERWGLNGPHVDHDRIPNNTTYYRYPPCSEYWEATEDYPGITQEEALEQLVAWADAHKAYSIGGSLKLTVELTWDEDWAKKPIFTVHVQEGIQIQNCRPQDYLHDVQTWSRNLTYTVGRGQECISDGQIRRDVRICRPSALISFELFS